MSELEFDTVFDGEDAIRTEEDSAESTRSLWLITSISPKILYLWSGKNL